MSDGVCGMCVKKDQGSQASLFLPIQEPVPPSPSKPDCGGEWYVFESASLLCDIQSFCQG